MGNKLEIVDVLQMVGSKLCQMLGWIGCWVEILSYSNMQIRELETFRKQTRNFERAIKTR